MLRNMFQTKDNKMSMDSDGFSTAYFEIGQIETYLNVKKFPIDLNKVGSQKILMILSGENEGYKIYKTSEQYFTALNSIIEKLASSSFFIQDKKNYLQFFAVITTEELIQIEQTLFELCLIFRFSAFLGLKKNITNQAILRIINKFSLYSIFNLKRWKSIADWQLFFDGEHLSGKVVGSW